MESVTRPVLGKTVGVCAWCHSLSLLGPRYMFLCSQNSLWVIHQNSDTQYWGGPESQRLLCYARGLVRWTLPRQSCYTHGHCPVDSPCSSSVELHPVSGQPLSSAPSTSSLALSLAIETNKTKQRTGETEGVMFCTYALSEWRLSNCLTSFWALASSYLE